MVAPARASAAAIAPPTPVPVAATTSPAEPAPAAARPVDPISARLAAGRELLAEGSGARYAVQLMVTDAREREYLASWLAEAGRAVEPGKLVLVPSGNAEAPRLGVLFGAYAERGAAADALGTLPVSLRQFRPYVRSIDAVREDARRAQSR